MNKCTGKPIIKILFFGFFLFISCNGTPNKDSGVSVGTAKAYNPDNDMYYDAEIFETEYKGHLYIYTRVSGGTCYSHAAHCECQYDKKK